MLIPEQDFEKYLTISRGLAKKSIRTYLQRFRIINRWLEESNLPLNKRTVEDFLYRKKTEEKLSNATENILDLQTVHSCPAYDL